MIEDQQLELEHFEALQEERQKLINQYLAEEDNLKMDEEYKRAVNKAAVLIQSLWKGYMVRHRLGRYKRVFETLKNKRKKKGKKRKKRAKKM